MNKPLKYGLLGLLGLLVLVIVGAAVFALTFDPNRYKGEVERLVKERTGRTLAIQGPIGLAFWPSLGVEVSGVSLSEKGSAQPFASFDSAHASVKVLPLLRGAYVVDGVKLSGAKARIVKNKDGSFNFSDLTGGGAGAQKSGAEKPAGKAEEGGGLAFDVASVEIDRASIQYVDQLAGQEYAIDDFRLKTGRIAPDAEGKLELGMVAKRKAPALTVKLAADGRYQFKDGVLHGDLTAKLDDSTIKAKFTAAEPYNFEASIDKLNVDRYLGEAEKPQARPAQKGAPAAQTAKSDDAPVDLSGLKGLNARGKLSVGELQVRGLKVAELNAQLNAQNGRVAIAPHSAKLYEGSVSGEVVLDANRNQIALKEQLKGIAIGPLLRDAAQKDLLEGKGDVTVDVTAAGKTVDAMKRALSGTARVQLADGAIKGINLAEIIQKGRNLLGRSDNAAAGESANDNSKRTDFSALSASFQIKNGVAHNEDLDVKAPLFRIGGKGDVDIGASKLDYTAKASVVATTQGQGGKERDQLAGLTVPVRLSGPLDDLKYQVDYRAMAGDAVKSEIGQKLKDRVGAELKDEKFRDKLKGLLGR